MQRIDMEFYRFTKMSDRLPETDDLTGTIIEWGRGDTIITIFDYVSRDKKDRKIFVIRTKQFTSMAYPLIRLQRWLIDNTLFAGSTLIVRGSQLLKT